MAKKINYISRDFVSAREDLINFVKQYYPQVMSDFNDASIGMMFIELNAAIADMLSYNTDRSLQETQIDYAQEAKSLLAMARSMGLKVPGKRPSICLVDVSATVPVFGDSYDVSYAPVIRRGAQLTGAGKVFETTDDIDFSNPFTSGGIPNRLIIPNRNSNGNIINYTITKREIVINGVTKIYKRVLGQGDAIPFLNVILPDEDVLSITSVITLEGTNYTKTPTIDQFLDDDNRWYEMEALADDKVFVEDSSLITDNSGIKPGKFIRVTKKFIKEYTDLGFTKVIFGGGNQDTSGLSSFGLNSSFAKMVGDFINNNSLGETPTANKTMFIQYRTGGGSNTNVGSNTITNISTIDTIVNGSDDVINNAVTRSIQVTNPIPALGGRDEPSIEEIRNLIRYNFSSQNRAVTVKDYLTRISLMPGEFGVPFRTGVWEEQNKIKVSILGVDESNNLTNSSTSTLRDNISTYLSEYRMMNDYIEVNNGKVFNLGFEIDLFINKQFPRTQIINDTINAVTDFLNKDKFEMGQNIYLSQLLENINNVGGVLNVMDLRVYNKVGENQYSLNEVSQPYTKGNEDKKQIDITGQYTLFGEADAMFEIRFPSKDILVRVTNS